MRMVVQRVKEASVRVDGDVVGAIDEGLLVFFGVHHKDTFDAIPWMSQKLVHLRCFHDAQGKMNRSLKEVGGQVLVVSQFTLYADCSEGRRPDFGAAMAGPQAEALYNAFVDAVRQEMGAVQTGRFGARMEVSLLNDGPVTFLIER